MLRALIYLEVYGLNNVAKRPIVLRYKHFN